MVWLPWPTVRSPRPQNNPPAFSAGDLGPDVSAVLEGAGKHADRTAFKFPENLGFVGGAWISNLMSLRFRAPIRPFLRQLSTTLPPSLLMTPSFPTATLGR